MKKIAIRQLLFFLACIAPVGKIILLPSQLVYYSKNDLLLSALCNIVLQTASVFFVLWLSKSNQTLFSLIKNRLGRVIATVVTLLFSVFLLYCALLPLLEQRLFVQSVFYDTLPSLLAFSPFFALSAYLCFQPLSSFGRIGDLLAPLAIVGFVGVIALSLGEADFGALLPVGVAGASGIFKGAAFSLSWFFDSALLLALMGRFDYQKGLALKGALCYLLGELALIVLLAVFYGIFSEIALRQLFAFAKMTQYFPGSDVLGRIDYLFLYTLALVMAFYCALPLQASVECVRDAFSHNKILSFSLAVGVNLLMLLLSVLLVYSFQPTLEFITRKTFWIFPLFATLFPLLLLCIRRIREK